ncbi:uncharacterized protein LOC124270542 [Haliotis rubra]|uniref:uncharacterized protein LOC124270542 n=1 Tax=Haliotis rubra TaxID=36100 RepID=UPI001EE5D261|nr:uncharacterized protein LOC124270542 [Haliotis rubra]
MHRFLFSADMPANKVQFEPIFQYKNVIPLIGPRKKEDEKRKKLLTNLGGTVTGRSGLFQPCSNAHDFRHVPSSPYTHTRRPGSQQKQKTDGQGTLHSPLQQRQRSDGQGTQSSPRQELQRSKRLRTPYLSRLGSDGRRPWTSPYEKSKTSTQITPIAVFLPPALLNSVINARSGSLNIDLYPKRPQSTASLRAVSRGPQGKGLWSHDRCQSGLPRKGSVISSADVLHQGHRKKCSCDQNLCVHNEKVREDGGLVCTARCFNHLHKSCLYKVNFCQAASAYFPFDLYKWKKIEPKTPVAGKHTGHELGPRIEASPVDKIVPQQNKPNLTKQQQYDTLAYVKLRPLLPKLKTGERVFFKSPDDGWYYHGTVLQNCQNNLYGVSDVNGHQEEIWREDIIRQMDLKTNIKVGRGVLAEHPYYPLSYAPGKVVSVGRHGMSVRMYDGTETVVTTAHVALAPDKHNKDVADIKAIAEQWVHQTVLARNKVGEYHLARIVGIATTPHHYKVAWQQSASSNNSAEEEVEVVHLFGALTPIRPIWKNDYVLAPAQDKSPCYLPAKVTESGSNLKVMFVGKSERDVAESTCFWISSSYYMDAAPNYIHWRQRTGRSTP